MTAHLFSQIYLLGQRHVLIKAVIPAALRLIMPCIVDKEKKKAEKCTMPREKHVFCFLTGNAPESQISSHS